VVGVDSSLVGTQFDTTIVYYAAVFVVVSAFLGRDIVLHPPPKNQQRPKVWYPYILGSWWSPAVFVVGSAFQGRDIVMHPQEGRKKREREREKKKGPKA
jgi:hypothetical protein